MQKKQKGFTLIELLIVIAIIGLLATLAIVSLTSAQRKARDTKRVADIKSMQTALELYYNTESQYPLLAAGDDWADLQTELTNYVTTLPVDPSNDSGDAYTYASENVAVGQPSLRYVLIAELEDDNNPGLDQDTDGAVTASEWMVVTSTAVAAIDADDAVQCGVAASDTTYCLEGNASN